MLLGWMMFDCNPQDAVQVTLTHVLLRFNVSTLFMLLNPLSTSVVDNSQVILTIVCQH